MERVQEQYTKRHALYKSRMAELNQYRKLLQKQNKKDQKRAAAEKQKNKIEEASEEDDSAVTEFKGVDKKMQKHIDQVARAMVN